jgi:beta-N-acetylhexosaminidase
MSLGYTKPMKMRSLFTACALLGMILVLSAFTGPNQGGVNPAVQDLFDQMTDEERIGQLFMVTFQGKDLTPASDIYQLIADYNVGGILLRRENGNWKSGEGESAAVLTLANGLQQIEADSTGSEDADSGEFIPLFLSLSGGSDGYPTSQLVTDFSDIPSPMTIGATWQPELAEAAGEIVGSELSRVGINMYLGPSLDVLEEPNPGTNGDLGARAFGGDPFWVGKMGQAYIQGVQEGSNQKIAVIATHFPGIGASDRSPEEEVATIRKAMDDLRLIDLAPFVSVAGTAPGVLGITDGLLVSHIRYQGLQGNIRTSTRPISLDPQALSQLMALPEFTAWRAGGGITVSESLGATSMRKFYEAIGATFSNKHVAFSAFQAGNDILQLSDVIGTEDQSEFQVVIDTIRYFQQKYAEDQEFAERVDQAVLRILSLKNRLYPVFAPQLVQRSEASLGNLKVEQDIPEEICRQGVTLISPNPETMIGTEIEPPTSTDRIVVLTDSRMVTPCPACSTESDIAPTLLADTILRLYGPGASAIIAPSRIQSYTFRDLQGYLQGVQLPDLDVALNNSTVLVALIRTPSSSVPESSAFQNLLEQRAGLIRNKKIFIFALDAPYYLDSTEISKITSAYYGLYSKHPSCIEVAARVLLGDITPTGYSPVSIESVRYDLLTSLSPNPEQVIHISVSMAGESTPTITPTAVQTQTQTLEPTPMGFLLGDQITFTAGPVLDHNHHLVPDRTVLEFELNFPEEDIPPLVLDANILNGMAQADYVLNRPGLIQVSAYSEPAKHSNVLQLLVGEQPGGVTVLSPTSSMEHTPTFTAEPTGAASNGSGGQGAEERAGWDTLAVLLLALGVFGAAIIVLTNPPGLVALRTRILLGCLVGGLAGYDLIAIGVSGRDGLAGWGGRWISVVTGMIGGLLGAFLGWGSMRWKQKREYRS